MLNISQKKEIVARLSETLEKSEIAILVDYKGLNVAEMTDLRTKFRAENVQMEVVKNSLLEHASSGNDAVLMKDFYKGPNAIVLSENDPVSPAKVLIDFVKNNEKLEIKAAVLSGKLLTHDDIKQLAQLPNKKELLGNFVCLLNAIPTSFVNVLSGVPRGLVNALNAIKDQKEAA